MATPLLRVSSTCLLVTVVMAIIIIIHCRCVSEYSSAGDEGVAFGGD